MAVIKRSVKTWMLVYVAFLVAFAAAGAGEPPKSDLAALSPGSLPSAMSTDKAYFRPAVEQARRNDI
jgi:hypothetical protein